MGEDDSGVTSPSLSERCPAEDAIQALLDYLVDPVLPLKRSVDEAPSLAQQAVAKQVHAVVLLYNYYQRKRHPDIESLGFESFAKLAVILKPALMGHMKLMHLSDYAMLDNLEEKLSVLEKTIMDACDISSALHASKDASKVEAWPVSKVSVLLTDSSRENCLLQFSSITHGVWSVIEKDRDISTIKSKRKRKSKKLSPEEANAEEVACLQLALSSVKEATGIDEHDLLVLESHVVYSLSKEKTAVRFYIVQCMQSISRDLQVSIRSVIESLQGPLFRKSSSSWTVTPVVEYFHLLPYSGILLDCLSRRVFSDTMPRVESLKEDDSTFMRIDVIHDKEDTEDIYDSDANPSKRVIESRDNSDKSSDTMPRVESQKEDDSTFMTIDGIHEKEDTEDIYESDLHPSKKVIESGDNSDKISDAKPRLELQKEDASSFMRIDGIHDKENTKDMYDSDVNPSKKVIESGDNSDKKSDKEVSGNGDNSNKSSSITASAVSKANETDAEALGQRDDSARATVCFSDTTPRVELKKEDGSTFTRIDGIHDKEGTEDIYDSDASPSKKVIRSRDNSDKNSDKKVSGNGDNSKRSSMITAFAGSEANGTNVEAFGQRDDSASATVCFSDTMLRVELQKADDRTSMRIDGIQDKEDTEDIYDSDVIPSKKVIESSDNCDKNSDKEVGENEDNSNKISVINDFAASEANETNAEALGQRNDSARATVCFSDTIPRVDLQKEDDSTLMRIDGIVDTEDINDPGVNPSKKVIDSRDNSDKNSDKEVSEIGDSSKTFKITDSASSEASAEAYGQRDNSANATVCVSNSSTGPRDMDIDDSSADCRQNENVRRINNNITKFYQRRTRTLAKRSTFKISKCLEKLHDSLASDKNASETALRFLMSKKRKLSHQVRTLEDEIADCDEAIQAVVDGLDEDMTLKIQSIIDACNNVCLKDELETEKETCLLAVDERSPLHRRKKLAEAVLDLQDSCQELDNICYINNWNLPSYNVSPTDDKFQAKVTVKGLDFEFSEGGDVRSSRRSARESAAAKMITRLQSMAGQSRR